MNAWKLGLVSERKIYWSGPGKPESTATRLVVTGIEENDAASDYSEGSIEDNDEE